MLNLGVINTLGKVTSTGNFILKLPYGIRQSVTLYRWKNQDYPLYPAIVILSMIDSYGKSYYVYPNRTNDTTNAEYNLELLEHKKQYFLPFARKSDVHTYANIWSVIMDEVGGPEVPSSDIKMWCNDNFIRFENISSVISLSNRVMDILNKDLSVPIRVGPFNADNLMDLVGPILVDVYSDKRMTLDPHTQVRVRYIDGDNKFYKINNQDSINTIEMDQPVIVFGLITSTIKSEYTSDFNTIVICMVR
jgi:hypothetical protein